MRNFPWSPVLIGVMIGGALVFWLWAVLPPTWTVNRSFSVTDLANLLATIAVALLVQLHFQRRSDESRIEKTLVIEHCARCLVSIRQAQEEFKRTAELFPQRQAAHLFEALRQLSNDLLEIRDYLEAWEMDASAWDKIAKSHQGYRKAVTERGFPARSPSEATSDEAEAARVLRGSVLNMIARINRC